MYDPAYAEPDENEPPTENNPRNPRHSASNQPETKELITEPRPAVQKASSERMTSTSQHKMSQAQLPPQNVQPESSYQNTSGRQTKTVQRTPIHATTQPDREQVRQKNQQQTRLPLLSSVIMREVSQAFRDYAPQNSQQDAAIIYRRLLLINRIQDDLTIKNPDQHFANLIKSVFQDLLAVSKQQHETNSNIDQMDNFMTELNHAAFYQFEQIKIMRHQRKNSGSQYSRVSPTHASQPPKPIQLAEQETVQQLDHNGPAATLAANHTRVQQRAKNFPVGEELVALAQHMHISMSEEEANEIEIGIASEQLLLDIQDAILLSYDQQPDIIANVNYA
jgi:hypothetical protein